MKIEIGLDLSLHVGDTVEIDSKSLNQLSDGTPDKMTGGKYLIMEFDSHFCLKKML